MNTKVLIVQHNERGDVVGENKLQEKVDKALTNIGEEWEVVSASTHSCTRPMGSLVYSSGHISTECGFTSWTTTILLKKF